MKFASEEIRSTVVHAYLEGKADSKKLSEIFGYSVASICNWVRIYLQENRLAAKPNGHRKSCFSDEELEQLKTLVEERPDMTLEEIREYFSKTCSLTAIHVILVKMGYVVKKNSKSQRTRSRRCKRGA